MNTPIANCNRRLSISNRFERWPFGNFGRIFYYYWGKQKGEDRKKTLLLLSVACEIKQDGKRIYKPDWRNKEREREEVEINVNDLRSLTGVTTTAVPRQNIYYSVVYAGVSKISTSQSSQHMSRITANNHQSLKLTKCHLKFAGHFVPCKGIYRRQSWILDSAPWFQIPGTGIWQYCEDIGSRSPKKGQSTVSSIMVSWKNRSRK